jgi:hypothetical protein
MKVIIFILFSFSLFANETHLERRDRIREESVLKKSTLSKCKFKKIVEIKKIIKDRVIPTLERSNIKVVNTESPYFKLSRNTVGLSVTFFKGAALLLPFTLIADIIATPVYAGKHIKDLISKNKVNRENKKIINKSLKDFKTQWDALNLTKLQKLSVINNLRFYQLLDANYQWISDSEGLGEVYVPKEDFSFLYPFMEDHLDNFKVKSAKEVYFNYGKKKKLDLFRYFHISKFSDFLHFNQRLCDISPLLAMRKLGILYADDIKKKASQY